MTKDLKIFLVFVGILALSMLLILSFELSLSVKNLPTFAAGRTMRVSVKFSSTASKQPPQGKHLLQHFPCPLDTYREFESSSIKTEHSIASSVDNITSAKYTRVKILNPQPVYRLCDRLDVFIEARDSLNRTKMYGGDMFRLKLYSERPYAAVSADSIIDFQNGSYLASFHTFWEGHVRLQVMLVHPAEAYPLFSPSLNGSRAHMQKSTADFQLKGTRRKTVKETTACSPIKIKDPFCNFSDTLNYAPWFCSSPKNLNCSHLTTYRTDIKGSLKALKQDIDTVGAEVLLRTKTIVLQSDLSIFVNESRPSYNKTSSHFWGNQVLYQQLPACKAEGPPSLHTHGYFFNNTWFPFDCKVSTFSTKDYQTCLEGKTIRFFGDSTARQFYFFLKERLNCTPIELEPPRITNTREFRCRTKNITLHFHFHGLPNGQAKPIAATSNHYAATEIDHLKGGPNLIVFLSYWAHFSIWGLQFFEHRIKSVRESVIRLLQRAPETKVVVKGGNTRDMLQMKQFILVSSDWNTFEQEKNLRQWFASDTNFGYIDAWDITQSQPFRDKTHPETLIIENLVNRFMTYICKPQTENK